MDALSATPNRRRARDDDKATTTTRTSQPATLLLLSFLLVCLLYFFVSFFSAQCCKQRTTKSAPTPTTTTTTTTAERVAFARDSSKKQEAGPSREDVLLQLPPLAPLQWGKSLLKYAKKTRDQKESPFPPAKRRFLVREGSSSCPLLQKRTEKCQKKNWGSHPPTLH